jgi:2-polyprenyl-3-methyl-5-hydroxy-6-metoxy-1,4-benzoquinol methylase
MKTIPSTLSPKNMAFRIEEFDSILTIKLYNEIGLDVKSYFSNDYYELYQCEKTGYRFYNPNSLIGDSSFYEELSRNRKNYYSARWEHRSCLQFINKQDHVLEIGSGFGSFLSQLRELNIKAEGLELNPHAVEYCKEQGLKVKNEIIEDFIISNENFYDVVCSFQVLEHIYDVHSFIKKQIEVLKPGGKLIIGVPNSNPYLFMSDKYHTLNLPPHHAGLWNKTSLKSMEKVFPLKLKKLSVEPLNHSYDYFIQYHKNQIEQNFLRKSLSWSQKYFPQFLKMILCSSFEGRNILAVYTKV